MNDEKQAACEAVLSSDGLGVTVALVPCPFCGSADGYREHEGSTFRWRYLHCANCGEVVAEARNTARPHEIPTDATPRYMAGDEAWNEAGAYADELRYEAELFAWVLAHPETAAECLNDAAAGDGTARDNLELRRDALLTTNVC